MRVTVLTQKGHSKLCNEDRAFVLNDIIEDGYYSAEIRTPFIAGLADGVGGNPGGADAAQYVCEQIRSCSLDSVIDEKTLTDFLCNANNNLLEYAAGQNSRKKMATTFSGFLRNDENTFIFHIGNTRIYAIQGSYLKQLTKDTTTYQWLLQTKNTDDLIECNKNELISCMGGGTANLFKGLNVFQINLPEKTHIIITTDGIHDYVDIDALEELLCGVETTELALKKIVNKAVNNGSTDDATIMVLEG